MPNDRDKDQTNISVWIDKKLLAEIEKGRRKLRSMERSQFIRDAIKEKLQSLGLVIPDEIVLRPDRATSETSPSYGQKQTQSQGQSQSKKK